MKAVTYLIKNSVVKGLSEGFMLKIATVSGEVYFWLLVWKKFKHTDYIIKTFYFLIAVLFLHCFNFDI